MENFIFGLGWGWVIGVVVSYVVFKYSNKKNSKISKILKRDGLIPSKKAKIVEIDDFFDTINL